jgi:hypothetical protein
MPAPGLDPKSMSPDLIRGSDDEFAAILGAPHAPIHQQLARAQACLDLYEKDRASRALTAQDIRIWADVQDPETLRFRIARHVRAAEVWTQACKKIWTHVPAPLATRPPLGQRIVLSLEEAARTAGVPASAIRAAIADGRIDAIPPPFPPPAPARSRAFSTRYAGEGGEGDWMIERAELCRAFPLALPAAAGSDDHHTLDAHALVLELAIAALVTTAGDTLRRRPKWRLRGRR